MNAALDATGSWVRRELLGEDAPHVRGPVRPHVARMARRRGGCPPRRAGGRPGTGAPTHWERKRAEPGARLRDRPVVSRQDVARVLPGGEAGCRPRPTRRSCERLSISSALVPVRRDRVPLGSFRLRLGTNTTTARSNEQHHTRNENTAHDSLPEIPREGSRVNEHQGLRRTCQHGFLVLARSCAGRRLHPAPLDGGSCCLRRDYSRTCRSTVRPSCATSTGPAYSSRAWVSSRPKSVS